MKRVVLFFLIVLICLCGKEAIEAPPTIVRVHGKYTACLNGDCWQWKFVADNATKGTLHTWNKSGYNNCGLYFYSMGTDTLICVAGNMSPVVYRGNTYMLEDTIYFESQEGIIKMFR